MKGNRKVWCSVMGIYMSESEKGGMFCKKVVEVNVAQMGVDCS